MDIDQIRDRASLLSENEWSFIVKLLAYEIECNENATAKTALGKLIAPTITMAERTARQRAERI
jgi:hypothetical protein